MSATPGGTAAARSVRPPPLDVEAEFDQLFSSLMARRASQPALGQEPASRSPASSEEICTYVAEVIDSEGVDAVTMRRVAAELGMSTRTLYKRIGNREVMIGAALRLRAMSSKAM